MAFGEKLTRFITGKTKTERLQEAAAMKEIRKQAMAAGLKERQAQAIRLAQERERITSERRLRQMKQPSGFFSGFQKYYGAGQPQKQIIITKRKKGKKTVIQKRVRTPRRAVPYVDLIGFGGGRRTDILGI